MVWAVVTRAVVDCSRCGRHFEIPFTAKLTYAGLIYRVGAASPNAFHHMRDALALSGPKLGALLNVRPETISRWELGKSPVDRAAWCVLGTLVEDVLGNRTTTQERLEAARAPQIPKDVVTLEAPATLVRIP